MKYFEYTLSTHPCTETVNDVLAAILGEVGFESFVECEGGLTAYIQQTLCDENAIKIAINEFPLPDTDITYTYTEAEDKDWNEEWEKNFFQPIIIGNRCVIHSTFHQDVPKAGYDIVINPQMAFGTGHHETTSLINVDGRTGACAPHTCEDGKNRSSAAHIEQGFIFQFAVQ